MDGNEMTAGPPNRETLATILKFVAVVMALWALYAHLIGPFLLDDGAAGGTAVEANRIGIHLLMLTPTIFYVWGIWLLARFLGNDGPAAFGAAGLTTASRTLLIGVLMDVIVVPTLLAWIVHRGGYGINAEPGLLALAALAVALPFAFGHATARAS
jgi:hypothetical protein